MSLKMIIKKLKKRNRIKIKNLIYISRVVVLLRADVLINNIELNIIYIIESRIFLLFNL